MPNRRTTALTLALCLGAPQAALLILTPILSAVAAEVGISTATAGQLRTISGLAAGTTALLSGLGAARAATVPHLLPHASRDPAATLG